MTIEDFIPIIHIGKRNLNGKLRDFVSNYLEVEDNTNTFVEGFAEYQYICEFGEKIMGLCNLDEQFKIMTELIAGSISFTTNEKETLLLTILEEKPSLEWVIQFTALLIMERYQLFNNCKNSNEFIEICNPGEKEIIRYYYYYIFKE